ncbi:MAG TPA: CAP domain-containing protein [Anaerolineales bacterium]|nr:CAP domain-containing protein [Anaerolineales bacterium]
MKVMHRWEFAIKAAVFITIFSMVAINTAEAQTNQDEAGEFLAGTGVALVGYDPLAQTPALLYNEAQAVYLGNLQRRNHGIPPLRWNRQLTHAARWFSWDSTENRPPYCGHQDTQGNWADDRALFFGYLGLAGAENAYCDYLSPEDAIRGWMDSPGHRGNLLDPNSREIGLGYYRRDSDGRGYVTQDFGNDAVYAPVIIENEALSTSNPNVNLYIYDRLPGAGFAGLVPATQMMVSNNALFAGAAWEPYNANKSWTLASGAGWRDVYVKTRDTFNRTLTVSDAIYLGSAAPLYELGSAQMSTTRAEVILYHLNGGGLPHAQFSLGWLADDTYGTFEKLWGNGERVNDPAAWGGTAYRLSPGNGESQAWVWDTAFIQDTPFVAYFRLKVNNNSSNSEVARISVLGGDTEYGPVSLRGIDFTAPNQYQEFAVSFTFSPTSQDPFLMFNFWRSGSADVYVDAVSIFSAPQAISPRLAWSVSGGNYRGQGVWVRYTNGNQFSALSEADTIQTFGDISEEHWAWDFIERLSDAGVTSGCGTAPLMYCPAITVTRDQMAVFLLRGKHGSSYDPPTATGDFEDVPVNFWSAAWIEQLADEGITSGCNASPRQYCPTTPVTRDQMAVFLLKARHGSDYAPPEATGVFDDVPPDYWAADWIEQLANEGITSGCSVTPKLYCPTTPVTRDQMAVFLVRSFNLP